MAYGFMETTQSVEWTNFTCTSSQTNHVPWEVDFRLCNDSSDEGTQDFFPTDSSCTSQSQSIDGECKEAASSNRSSCHGVDFLTCKDTLNLCFCKPDKDVLCFGKSKLQVSAPRQLHLQLSNSRIWEVMVSDKGEKDVVKWATCKSYRGFKKVLKKSFESKETKNDAMRQKSTEEHLEPMRRHFSFHENMERMQRTNQYMPNLNMAKDEQKAKRMNCVSYSDTSEERCNPSEMKDKMTEKLKPINGCIDHRKTCTSSVEETNAYANTSSTEDLNIDPLTREINTLKSRRRSRKSLVALPLSQLKQLQNSLSCVTETLSETLITQLTQRDDLVRAKEMKNEFIALFLSLQRKQREVTVNQNWRRRATQEGKYLDTTIPYIPSDDGQPTMVIGQLTKILKAILDNNSKVPEIVTAYILKESKNAPLLQSLKQKDNDEQQVLGIPSENTNNKSNLSMESNRTTSILRAPWSTDFLPAYPRGTFTYAYENDMGLTSTTEIFLKGSDDDIRAQAMLGNIWRPK